MPDLRQLAAQAARQYNIPVPLFLALIGRESGWNPGARSPAGALGLGQLMPATARGLGVTDPFNPAQNLQGAARYLADQFSAFHNPRLALAAYNAGPGAVQRYHGVPPYGETQAYVANVIADAAKLGGGATAPPSTVVRQRPAAAAPPAPVQPTQPQPTGGQTRRTLALALLSASKTGNYQPFIRTLTRIRQQAAQPPPQPRTAAPVAQGGYQPPRTQALPGAPPSAPQTMPTGGLVEAFYDPLGSYDNGKFGGAIGGHSDHVHLSITSPPTMLAAIRHAQQLGLRVSENPYLDHVDPVHVADSYHYRTFPGKYNGRRLGEAIDVSGDPKLMAAFYKWATTNLR